MTKREMFERIATLNENDAEIVAFCEHEIELLANRKSSKKKGLTPAQKENENVKLLITEILTDAPSQMTAAEIGACEGLKTYSTNKISMLLRQMIGDGKVHKETKGKKSYYSLVVDEG